MTELERVRFERSKRAMGVYIEGIAVYADGTEERLASTTVGSSRAYTRIRSFEERCREKVGA